MKIKAECTTSQFEKQNCNFIMLSHLVNDKSFSLIEGMMECYKNNGNRILSKPTTKAQRDIFLARNFTRWPKSEISSSDKHW